MSNIVKRSAIAGVAFGLVWLIGGPMQLAGQGATQTRSLLDPSLRTGVLPNGIRYYVKENRIPEKRAMLWLAVNAGSIQEDENQRGYAHFVEHMAFNGTRRFPGNTLVSFIEQVGMTFGGDLNATTSFDRTVYQLTIPTDDSAVFRTGMDILDDWATGGITFDSLQVVGERGVVIGEWRMRLPDTAAVRLQHEQLERMFGKGSRYVDRLPIGWRDQLEVANPALLRKFYQDWYQPSRLAVIAVGDFDGEKVEADIVRRFSLAKAASPARNIEVSPVTRSVTTTVHVIKDRIRPQAELAWPALEFRRHEPKDVIRGMLLENIVFATIQSRLARLSKLERRPFVTSAIGRSVSFASVIEDSYVLRIAASPDSLLSGLMTAVMEVERVAQHGLALDELDHQKAVVLRQYEAAAALGSTLHSKVLAQRYVQHYLTGIGELWSPQQALNLARSILSTLRSEDIRAFAKRWREETGRIATVQMPASPGVPLVTEADVRHALDSASRMQIAENGSRDRSTGRDAVVRTLPPAKAVVSESRDTQTGIVRWTLANGAVAVFKPSSNNPDDVTIYATSEGGHSQLPDTLFFSAGRLVAPLMTSAGGFDSTSHSDLERMLTTTGVRRLEVNLNAFNEEIILGGSPRDLTLLFQLTHAQFTKPSFDTLSLTEWRRTGFSTIRISQNDRTALGIVRHRRLMPPEAVNVPFLKVDQAMRVYHDRFGDASDFTFYIIGATTADKVRPLVEQYIATLPSTNRKVRETPADLKIPYINRRVSMIQRSPRLQAEQSQTQISFQGKVDTPALDYIPTIQRMHAVSIILSHRIRNKLREEMAVTYSAGAPVVFYRVPDERYVMPISFITDPSVMQGAVKAVWGIIDSLRELGPTEDEVQMAKTTIRRRLENEKQSNAWWISQFRDADHFNLSYRDFIGDREPNFSVEDVRKMAATILSKDFYTEVTILPTKETLEKSERRN